MAERWLTSSERRQKQVWGAPTKSMWLCSRCCVCCFFPLISTKFFPTCWIVICNLLSTLFISCFKKQAYTSVCQTSSVQLPWVHKLVHVVPCQFFACRASCLPSRFSRGALHWNLFQLVRNQRPPCNRLGATPISGRQLSGGEWYLSTRSDCGCDLTAYHWQFGL